MRPCCGVNGSVPAALLRRRCGAVAVIAALLQSIAALLQSIAAPLRILSELLGCGAVAVPLQFIAAPFAMKMRG